MDKYTVEIVPKVEKEFLKLPEVLRNRICLGRCKDNIGLIPARAAMKEGRQNVGRWRLIYDRRSLEIIMLFLFISEIKPSFFRLFNSNVTVSLVAPTRLAIS